LQSYSPDFNQIEKAFAKLTGAAAQSAKRTFDGFWTAIDRPRRRSLSRQSNPQILCFHRNRRNLNGHRLGRDDPG
jgi:hypothetical protein